MRMQMEGWIVVTYAGIEIRSAAPLHEGALIPGTYFRKHQLSSLVLYRSEFSLWSVLHISIIC